MIYRPPSRAAFLAFQATSRSIDTLHWVGIRTRTGTTSMNTNDYVYADRKVMNHDLWVNSTIDGDQGPIGTVMMVVMVVMY